LSNSDEWQNDSDVFSTGHSVFDEIMKLKPGSMVLLTDETYIEGFQFLRTLLQNNHDKTIELVSTRQQKRSPGIAVISLDSLQDLSIQVNQLRRAHKYHVFIHNYLPKLLVKHNPDEVLKLLEIWQNEVITSGNLEFYLIARNTFEGFEKKFRSIVDAVLDIYIDTSEGKLKSYIKPAKIENPRYHLKNIQYEIKDGRLYLEWCGVLLENLPKTVYSIDEVKKQLDTSEDCLLIKLAETNFEVTSLSDYVLFTTINNRRVSEVKQLFFDRWESIREKLAGWATMGVIVLEKVEPRPSYPIRTKLKLRNRLLLSVPTSLATKLILVSMGVLGKRVRIIPLDAHLTVLEAMKRVIDYSTRNRAELRKELEAVTHYFGELSARETALEYLKRLEKTPYAVFRTEDASKIIATTLRIGWGLDIQIKKKTNEGCVFEIKECHLCEGVKSNKPFCDKFVSSAVVGVLGVFIKKRVECVETSCKALGADQCEFKVSL